jgi:hypothetical protein
MQLVDAAHVFVDRGRANSLQQAIDELRTKSYLGARGHAPAPAPAPAVERLQLLVKGRAATVVPDRRHVQHALPSTRSRQSKDSILTVDLNQTIAPPRLGGSDT